MTQGTEKKDPWVKVSIKSNGEVTVVGEGFNNAIEIMTALSTGVEVLKQQLVNQARVLIPGMSPTIRPLNRG